ncbi:MAG TPA: phospho-sugar mutase [Spirochaetota bacterium]|nr:phospho-sugar mutase [Spirochaetota bacterium]
MEKLILDRIREWTSSPFDRDTIAEIELLNSSGETRELEDRFYRTLEFGTGGLRGVIGAGTNRMNIYTVGMATQGLANYINSLKLSSPSVVIARDSRNKSDIFADEAASILAGNGIRALFFREISPTPFASFAVRDLGATAAIVITASHNPPEYNGFKVYWDDGGQIVPPHDKNIISEVEKIESVSLISRMDHPEAVKTGMIEYIDERIYSSYLRKLGAGAPGGGSHSAVRIAYTPLHGSGCKIIPDVLRLFGFSDLHVEESQSAPDGNFPTVKSPNPEEREALTRVIDLAAKVKAGIVLATDPDADRMGAAVRDHAGKYVLLNGNQIGALLMYYTLLRTGEKGALPEKSYVVKTIVTTDLQAEIAKSFGCAVYDVLTGFKWIAAVMKENEKKGMRYLFGGEESYGYLPVDFVRDKDAVSSCYFFAEMAAWLASSGRSPLDMLDEIYGKFGFYLEDLHSITMKGREGQEKIKSIMRSLRKNPPSEIAAVGVASFRDILELSENDPSTGRKESITGLPSSDVVQLFLADGSKISLRPSGTEPKIKLYFSVREIMAGADSQRARTAAQDKIAALKKAVLKKLDQAMDS